MGCTVPMHRLAHNVQSDSAAVDVQSHILEIQPEWHGPVQKHPHLLAHLGGCMEATSDLLLEVWEAIVLFFFVNNTD